MEQQLLYYLALWRTSGIGPVSFFKIVEQFPEIPKEITPDWAGAERDLAWLAQSPDHHIITWKDTAYPPLLREIAAAPPLLFARGNKALLSLPQIAMVGSRHPTKAGSELAEQFACALSESGFIVTSGLALGIDAACHEGALAGSGLTIGVMGTGPDQIYPARHKDLAEKILKKGVIISELPVGVGPQAAHFPRRNRLISGLSMGVLVVEAAVGSGSLITARYANEQGREVFAIPGSIHNPLARGCHKLIRQGAKLVETANDVFEELKGLMGLDVQVPFTPLPTKSAGRKQERGQDVDFLNNIDFAPTPMDTIITRSGLTAGEVSSMLSLLELQGHVSAIPGGYVRVTE